MDNKKMIFVVDDDEGGRISLEMILNHKGYEVMNFVDGKKAWDEINEKKNVPNLLITDKQMPEMGGIQLAVLVKSSHNIPIIMVSGDCKKPEGCPIDVFMGKPFDYKFLLKEVDRLIKIQPSS